MSRPSQFQMWYKQTWKPFLWIFSWYAAFHQSSHCGIWFSEIFTVLQSLKKLKLNTTSKWFQTKNGVYPCVVCEKKFVLLCVNNIVPTEIHALKVTSCQGHVTSCHVCVCVCVCMCVYVIIISLFMKYFKLSEYQSISDASLERFDCRIPISAEKRWFNLFI